MQLRHGETVTRLVRAVTCPSCRAAYDRGETDSWLFDITFPSPGP
jgi:hypothetical protein